MPSLHPASEQAGSITALFREVRAGDSLAARRLWERYFPRLHQLARKILSGRELPLGAEDAVQTAFFRFLRRVECNQVSTNANRDDLWRILSMLTAQLASKQRRGELAQKRGRGHVQRESDLSPLEGEATLDMLLGTVTPPECDLVCVELLEMLEPDLREIALLRLASYTNAEIKDITGRPLRSIERRLTIIRKVWLGHLDA
jgi:DNA-directed RNA polymerase specialized sigma24 family protein